MTLINKWYGGISGDEYFGTQGQHFNNENVDIYSNLKHISLKNKHDIVNYNKSFGIGDITSVIKQGPTSFGSYVALVNTIGGSLGGYIRIWYQNNTPDDGSSYYVGNTNFPLNYVPIDYVDDGTDMHYFAVNGDSLYYNRTTINVTQNTPSYIVGGFTLVKNMDSEIGYSGARSCFATLTTSGKIYFAVGPYLFYAFNGVFLQVNSQKYKSDICGITEHSENIFIYLEDGTCFVMGIADNAIKGSKNISDRLTTAYSLGDFDVVFGENYSFENSGLGVQSQKKLGFKMNIEGFRSYKSYHGSFDWDGEKLVFIGSGVGQNAFLGFYGNKQNGITRAYSITKPEIIPETISYFGRDLSYTTKPNEFRITSINGRFLSFSKNSLFSGVYEMESWYISEYSQTKLNSGFVETLKDDGGQIGVVKTLDGNVHLGAMIPETTSVSLYYKLNNDDAYVLYETVVGKGVDMFEHKISKSVGNFNSIQWKIVLNEGLNSTPVVYDFDYKIRKIG